MEILALSNFQKIRAHSRKLNLTLCLKFELKEIDFETMMLNTDFFRKLRKIMGYTSLLEKRPH